MTDTDHCASETYCLPLPRSAMRREAGGGRGSPGGCPARPCHRQGRAVPARVSIEIARFHSPYSLNP